MATPVALPAAHRDSVLAIARRFGIPERDVTVAPRQGQVNLTIFLGDELVLRLPRQPRFQQRLAKEAEVIPVVVERGIPTSRLVSFDSGHTIADLSYVVLERLHGHDIDDIGSLPDGSTRIYRSLFEIVSSLHTLHQDSVPPIPGVETAEFSAAALLDELTTGGEIGSSQAEWLQRWFRHLEAQGARSAAPALLHGDVMPSNLIVNDSGDVTAIIDWGAACWGEPARDLAGFRTSALPEVVDIYRCVAGSRQAGFDEADSSLEAGVLWYQLFFALAKMLGRTSTSETRNWSAPRGARLLQLLRFFSTNIPNRWRALLQHD